MENATHALLMGGSMLLLIIALTVSISSLTTLKNTVDSIISTNEQTKLATVTKTDENGKKYTEYINYIQDASEIRTVGVETVISTVRRIKRESYTVYIKLNDMNSVSDDGNLNELVVTLDREQTYEGDTIVSGEVIELSIRNNNWKYINESTYKELYKLTKDSQFNEYFGIYQTNEDVSSANKTTYRVITYIQQ